MSSGPASAATMPGIVTIRPAVPSVTPSEAATSGSTPMGRNSVVTVANEPTASDSTAIQPDTRAGDAAAAPRRAASAGEAVVSALSMWRPRGWGSKVS